MPKVRRSKKRPPEGWELIEPTLDELDQKMREGECLYTNITRSFFIPHILIFFFCSYTCHFLAETESHEGKRRVEALWPIFK